MRRHDYQHQFLRLLLLHWLQIQYTTVASNFVKGVKLDGEGSFLAKFAGAGYQQVGVCWGLQ